MGHLQWTRTDLDNIVAYFNNASLPELTIDEMVNKGLLKRIKGGTIMPTASGKAAYKRALAAEGQHSRSLRPNPNRQRYLQWD